MTDPHRVLGVSADATQEEITSAYHRLVRRYHPDAAEDGAESDRFREVVAAYQSLRRRERDQPLSPLSQPAIRVGPVRYHGSSRG